MERTVELTDNVKYEDLTPVYQIRATKDFMCQGFSIHKGELGGYVNALDCFQDLWGWVDKQSIVINSTIRNAIIISSTVKDSKIEKARIEKSFIEDALVSISVIENTCVRQANLNEAVIVKSNVKNVSATKARIENARLTGVMIKHSKLIDTWLRDATVKQSFIKDITVNNVDFLDATVNHENDFLVLRNNWGSGRQFTWTKSNNLWKVGCFVGTSEELIQKAYADSEYKGKCYELTVNYAKQLQAIREQNQ